MPSLDHYGPNCDIVIETIGFSAAVTPIPALKTLIIKIKEERDDTIPLHIYTAF